MSHTGPFQAGEPVLLIDRRGRRYLTMLRAGHSQDLRGRLPHDALIGVEPGGTIRNDRGERFLALRPTLAEYVLEMPRGAQVIYPKDLALIVMWADVFPGARVAEAGTGSGALTMTLLRAVGGDGHVFSYDVREDFSARAARNIERYLGGPANLTLRLHDIAGGIPDAPVDRVILDLPEPWRVVAPAASALRPGGLFCAYVPTVPQVEQTVAALRGHGGFALVEALEALVRPWNVEGQSVRPAHRMVAHTGFLIVARHVAGVERLHPRPEDDRQGNTQGGAEA